MRQYLVEACAYSCHQCPLGIGGFGEFGKYWETTKRQEMREGGMRQMQDPQTTHCILLLTLLLSVWFQRADDTLIAVQMPLSIAMDCGLLSHMHSWEYKSKALCRIPAHCDVTKQLTHSVCSSPVMLFLSDQLAVFAVCTTCQCISLCCRLDSRL